jgi:hypothetical protein
MGSQFDFKLLFNLIVYLWRGTNDSLYH